MNFKHFTITVILFCFGLAGNIHSQELQATLDLGVGIPQGDFRNNFDHVGGGLNVLAGYRFKNSPVMVGLEFGFMNFGTETREEPLSSTIPDLKVEVENSYNLAHGDLFLRFIAPPSTIRPYLDGLIGFNYFFTQTVLRERGSFSDEDVLRDTNFEDTALSYGFGAGLQVRLWQKREEITQTAGDVEPSSVYLNLRSRYMFGRDAEYLQEGSIRRENGEVFYDVSESKTDLLHIKMGVVVNF